MNSLTLPPLSQATKLPETKKRILLAEIAMYWSILASPEIPRKRPVKSKKNISAEQFDVIFSQPKMLKKFDLLAEAVKGISS